MGFDPMEFVRKAWIVAFAGVVGFTIVCDRGIASPIEGAVEDAPARPPGPRLSQIAMPPNFHYDGIDIAPNGDLILTEGWLGHRVFRMGSDGTVNELATGLSGPVDVAVGRGGELYVSNFTGTTITRIDPDGSVARFADVPVGPTGICVDSKGNVFVAIFGVGYGTDDEVWKITPSGDASRFVAGHGMTAIIGLAIDERDRLYAASWRDGRIFRILPTGDIEAFASIPVVTGGAAIGHVEYCEGELFATCGGSVYRVAPTGAVSTLAATHDPGHPVAPLLSPLLRKSNGIAAAPNAPRLVIGGGSHDGARETIAIDLDRSPSLVNANRLLGLGRVDDAIAMLDALIEKHPQNAHFVVRLADVAYETGDLERADAAYAKLVQAPMLRGHAYVSRARCLARLGDIDRALRMLDRAVDAGCRDRAILLADPDLAAVRADDRFASLLERIDAGG